MKKNLMTSALLLLFATACIVIAGQSSKRDSKPADTQWEYLIVSGGNLNLSGTDATQFGSMRKQSEGAFSREAFVLERNLDKLGAKGWELVSVSGNPNDPVFYLKRPKESH